MKTVDISGFGEGYENTCQLMLRNGERFFKENPEIAKKAVYKGFSGVTGILNSESLEAKQLDTAILEGNDDATGAMHQIVVSHLMFIMKKGREAWVRELGSKKPGRIFEWDGTVKSCPVVTFDGKTSEEIRNLGREYLSRVRKGDTILDSNFNKVRKDLSEVCKYE